MPSEKCVHSIIELPVGVYGEIHILIKLNSLANHVNFMLVKSLPVSLKIYLLPPNEEYTPVR